MPFLVKAIRNLFFTMIFLSKGTISLMLLLISLIGDNEILKVHPKLMSDLNKRCECRIAGFNGYLIIISVAENLTTRFFSLEIPFTLKILYHRHKEIKNNLFYYHLTAFLKTFLKEGINILFTKTNEITTVFYEIWKISACYTQRITQAVCLCKQLSM